MASAKGYKWQNAERLSEMNKRWINIVDKNAAEANKENSQTTQAHIFKHSGFTESDKTKATIQGTLE